MATSDQGTTPGHLLAELGITEPEDIDVEAIAFTCGATTLYGELTGCEALLVGRGDRAIITVRKDSFRPRQRFSVGHELGHWMRDRGNVAYGCFKADLNHSNKPRTRERRANRFASDLLLPPRIFDPLARDRSLDLVTLRELATRFQTSLTATAIRLVRRGSFPAVLASYKAGRRCWYVLGESVPSEFTPISRLAYSTGAAKVGGTCRQGIDDTRSDHWFGHDRADRYYVRESWFCTSDDTVVALLWWEDEQQLLDFDEEE